MFLDSHGLGSHTGPLITPVFFFSFKKSTFFVIVIEIHLGVRMDEIVESKSVSPSF